MSENTTNSNNPEPVPSTLHTAEGSESRKQAEADVNVEDPADGKEKLKKLLNTDEKK